MNKRIIVILVAILVVLLAAIAVIEIVGSKDNDNNQGYDEVSTPTMSDIGEIYDLETDEVIGNSTTDNNSDVSNSTDDSSSSDNSSNESSSNDGSSNVDSSNVDSSNVDSSKGVIIEAGASTDDTQKEVLYTVKGVIVVDGKPLANTDLELHSKVKTTKTNKKGEFEFTDVEVGKHTLTVLKNGKKIGNMSFELKEGNKTGITSSKDGSYILSTEKNSGGVELNLKLNESKGTLKPTDAETVEKPETDSKEDSETDSQGGSSNTDSSNSTSSVNPNVYNEGMAGYKPWR